MFSEQQIISRSDASDLSLKPTSQHRHRRIKISGNSDKPRHFATVCGRRTWPAACAYPEELSGRDKDSAHDVSDTSITLDQDVEPFTPIALVRSGTTHPPAHQRDGNTRDGKTKSSQKHPHEKIKNVSNTKVICSFPIYEVSLFQNRIHWQVQLPRYHEKVHSDKRKKSQFVSAKVKETPPYSSSDEDEPEALADDRVNELCRDHVAIADGKVNGLCSYLDAHLKHDMLGKQKLFAMDVEDDPQHVGNALYGLGLETHIMAMHFLLVTKNVQDDDRVNLLDHGTVAKRDSYEYLRDQYDLLGSYADERDNGRGKWTEYLIVRLVGSSITYFPNAGVRSVAITMIFINALTLSLISLVYFSEHADDASLWHAFKIAPNIQS